jgi:hypothetical protein
MIDWQMESPIPIQTLFGREHRLKKPGEVGLCQERTYRICREIADTDRTTPVERA